jgi:hypothetical protein
VRNELEKGQQTPRQRLVMVVGEVLGIILLGNGILGAGTLRTHPSYRWLNIGLGSLFLILALYQWVKYLRSRRSF